MLVRAAKLSSFPQRPRRSETWSYFWLVEALDWCSQASTHLQTRSENYRAHLGNWQAELGSVCSQQTLV